MKRFVVDEPSPLSSMTLFFHRLCDLPDPQALYLQNVDQCLTLIEQCVPATGLSLFTHIN